jgi:hypothetical protein
MLLKLPPSLRLVEAPPLLVALVLMVLALLVL